MLKAIFFDADNTLYDTARLAKAADTAAMKVIASKASIAVKDSISYQKLYREWIEIIQRIKNSKNPRIRHRRYSYGLLGRRHGVKDIEPAYRAFFRIMRESIRAFPGAEAALKGLRKHYKLFVFTDDPRNQTNAKLEKTGLKKYFRQIISSDDTGVMKPNGKFFVKPMRKYGLRPSDCLVVGDDNGKDIASARRLGILTIKFRGQKGDADYLARNYLDVARIIRKLH